MGKDDDVNEAPAAAPAKPTIPTRTVEPDYMKRITELETRIFDLGKDHQKRTDDALSLKAQIADLQEVIRAAVPPAPAAVVKKKNEVMALWACFFED